MELIYRRKQENMPLTAYERDMLLEHGIEISACSKPLAIVHKGKRVLGLRIARMMLPKGKSPRPENFVINKKESPVFREFDVVISAIGSRSTVPATKTKGVFFAGDMILGSSTVVEAVATGKNAALEADAFLLGEKLPRFKNRAKSHVVLAGTQSVSRSPSKPNSSAARSTLRSSSLPLPTRTAMTRCARPTSRAGPEE